MSNFGFLNLRVVNPYEVAFRDARSAVGASEVLRRAEEYKSLAEAIVDCTLVVGTTAVGHREMLHSLHDLETGASMIRAELRQGQVALLFGTEKFGLSNNDLSHCHWLQRIPTRESHGSMNLGQAVAVCAYELARGSKVLNQRKPAEQVALATAAKLELLTMNLSEILRETGYVKPGASEGADEKIRRLVRRLSLSSEDADVCLGMLRQLAWKLRQGENRS
jgi:tRNA/rRNA methyltransferase